jgi:CHAT domain-containing protein/Tfp pilus assembly protein PilF
MQDKGQCHHRHRQNRRHILSAIILCTLALGGALPGCRDRSSAVSDRDPEAIVRNIRGDILRGDLTRAQQEAEAQRKSFSGRDAQWEMKFRLLEAEILGLAGHSEQVLALLDGKDADYAGDTAIKRKMLCGLAYAHTGQQQIADRELEEARHLSEASQSPLEGQVLQTQGIIETRRNHAAEAGSLFRESLTIAREQNDRLLEAGDLLNLGWLALQSEHYDEALDWFSRSSEIARSIQARVILESDLGNVGWALYKLGDYERALTNSQQAEEQARILGASMNRIEWLNNAGLCLYRLGDLNGAEGYYRKALEAAEALNSKELIADAHTWIGFLNFDRGQLDAAKAEADKALAAAQSLNDKSSELDPIFLEALLSVRQVQNPDPLLSLDRETTDTPSLQWEVENALGDYYIAKQQLAQAKLWYGKSIAVFETQRSAVQDEELKLPFFANGDALYRHYADLLIESSKPTDALQFLDLGRARTLEEGLNPKKGLARRGVDRAANAQSVARRLGAVILFYSLGPEKSYLWAVTANRIQMFVLPRQTDVDPLVQRYQKTILRSSDPLREANEDGRALYDMLIAPAASMIPQGSRVFVIPDGSLNGLNFETLLAPGQDGPHYWIDNVTVTSANSIRLLSGLTLDGREPSSKNVLLIGNPILPSTEYESLPNAAAEIGDVAAHFSPDHRTVLTQAEAVPTAYATSHPDRYSYIHFVAHGTASRLSPLDSAVVLSAEPRHPDIFKLYARDIVHQSLHARLVTISTCYGSGQRTYAGEGLVGLSWAFLRAGSHNVIGALWQVNDASTPQLMDRMYAELQNGAGPDAALRTAKLSLIHSGSVYRKPLYWGAFQLYAGS